MFRVNGLGLRAMLKLLLAKRTRQELLQDGHTNPTGANGSSIWIDSGGRLSTVSAFGPDPVEYLNDEY